MASGNTLLILTPGGNEPPAANFAVPLVRNQRPYLAFDQTTNESAVWTAIMPRHYAGGGITVYLHWAMTSVITGDVDWDVSFERVGDGVQDMDADSFATAKSIDNTVVPGTAGLIDIVSIAFANGAEIDSIAVGEPFRIKVTRDAVSDTATGDAELHAVEIKET